MNYKHFQALWFLIIQFIMDTYNTWIMYPKYPRQKKNLWIFSKILSEFVRILAAFSERWQNISKKVKIKMNSE